jgi:hypothetical protein
MKVEIILYHPDELAEHIEVRIDEEKEIIWLTQKQMSILFDKDSDTIGLHLKNIYFEKELIEISTTDFFSVVYNIMILFKKNLIYFFKQN